MSMSVQLVGSQGFGIVLHSVAERTPLGARAPMSPVYLAGVAAGVGTGAGTGIAIVAAATLVPFAGRGTSATVLTGITVVGRAGSALAGVVAATVPSADATSAVPSTSVAAAGTWVRVDVGRGDTETAGVCAIPVLTATGATAAGATPSADVAAGVLTGTGITAAAVATGVGPTSPPGPGRRSAPGGIGGCSAAPTDRLWD